MVPHTLLYMREMVLMSGWLDGKKKVVGWSYPEGCGQWLSVPMDISGK